MNFKPNDPAFPVSTGTNPGNPAAGITVRAHFAAMAMQALISHPGSTEWGFEDIAEDAILHADALIAELNK